MRTVGLIVVWVVMTVTLVLRFTKIEDPRSFIILYAMLTLYFGYLIWRYKRKGYKKEK